MKNSDSIKKFNNAGFSLLEVLIAVIILSIITVPFLRAFAVSAQTNAHAKLEAKATTAAENIMEDFGSLTIDQIMSTYATQDDEGNDLYSVTQYKSYENQNVYSFKVVDNAIMKADLPEGCYAEITLDPDKFENNNGLNVADFEPVSVKDSAIFTMKPGYDQAVYEEFVNRNRALIDEDSSTIERSIDDFAKELERVILVEITNSADITKVKLNISYKISKPNWVPADKTELVQTDAYLYDNTANKNPLNGVYIFFYPRYKCQVNGKDTITIQNKSDVECNVYATALFSADTNSVPAAAYVSSKVLTIAVNESNDTTKTCAATKLRTNMLLTNGTTTLRTPYSSSDTNAGYGLKFKLLYNAANPGTRKEDNAAADFLNLGDIDGKSYNTGRINTRIYRLNVKIRQDDGDDAVDDPILVEFNGTKLP